MPHLLCHSSQQDKGAVPQRGRTSMQVARRVAVRCGAALYDLGDPLRSPMG